MEAIFYDETQKLFSIHTAETTYQMKVDEYGVLLHLYYGRRMSGSCDFLLTYQDRGTFANINDAGNRRDYSYEGLPMEYPVLGMGDMRSPALVVENHDGTVASDFRFVSYQIKNGKYGLQGLPSVYADEKEAQSLSIVLCDQANSLELELLYGVLPDLDIITRSAVIRNKGQETVTLERVFSANLDFVTGKMDLMTFYGRHALERNLQREEVGHGERVIETRGGTSSHQYNPFMILCEKDANERGGTCYSMQLVYSGGFKGVCEKSQIDMTRLQMGVMEEKFSYSLDPSEAFTAPEAILSCSVRGFARLSQNLHTCIGKHVCRGKWRDIPRPVLLNSWEAFYFDFDGDKLLGLSDQAADLGIDMLVLDDGWFGARNDDNAGLGDWVVNEEKLGMPLGRLVEKVNAKGVKFGIWMEPEMVNEDSGLYRAHPDWALVIPGRKPVRGRNQLVLDFSRKEVVDHIYDQMCAIFDKANIEYLKWDFNRLIVDVYSCTAKNQGRVLHDYVLGLYDLLERIITRYPDMLIEGCCGGGGRFDAGMLYYTPQIWLSDNTDAIDRLRIQYGSSFAYPISAMGAHVSAVPNEENGRMTPLRTRSIVAMAGTYGYEMDPARLSGEEKDQIREEIKRFKKYERLIHTGKYYRLASPYEGDCTAWLFVSEDGSQALFQAVFTNVRANALPHYVRFQGLTSGALYKNDDLGGFYPADAMMQVGIPLPDEMKEYAAYQWHFSRCD